MDCGRNIAKKLACKCHLMLFRGDSAVAELKASFIEEFLMLYEYWDSVSTGIAIGTWFCRSKIHFLTCDAESRASFLFSTTLSFVIP